jgi:hypothetical protein
VSHTHNFASPGSSASEFDFSSANDKEVGLALSLNAGTLPAVPFASEASEGLKIMGGAEHKRRFTKAALILSI